MSLGVTPIRTEEPGLPQRQTHDYRWHGTTTLFAALNILNGDVIGSCLPRYRGREFVKFLSQMEKEAPAELDVHLMMIRRETLHSLHELERAIYRWLADWNDAPKAFVRRAQVDVILDKVRRCKELNGTAH